MGAGLFAALLALVVIGRGNKTRKSRRGSGGGSGGPTPESSYPPGEGTPPSAWKVGHPGEPEIDALLLEMEEMFLDAGVPPLGWSAEEITRMPKAPGQPVAIPPRGMWPNMIPTLILFGELREEMGVPLALRGYRDPSYNLAVSGAERSLHQWFSALDIYPTTGEDRNALGWTGAEVFVDADGEIGFGVYGIPPGNIHLDTGWRRRTWRDAGAYVDGL